MVKEIINPQRQKVCTIVGCEEMGRTIARLANIELNYCPKHRERAERIIRSFILTKQRYRIGKFRNYVKKKIFFEDHLDLCEKCNEKITTFIQKTAEDDFKFGELFELIQDETERIERPDKLLDDER